MNDGAGVGRRKSDARIPSACLATTLLTGSPRSLFCSSQSPLATRHRSTFANALSNRELQLLEPPLTHRKQTIAPRSNRELSTNPCRGNSHAVIPILTFLPGLPRAFFAKGSVCTSTFLTGSGSQTEFAVTHSKHTTAPFLTGSRFARCVRAEGTALLVARAGRRVDEIDQAIAVINFYVEQAQHAETEGAGNFRAGGIAQVVHSEGD